MNRLVFVAEVESVSSAVRTESLCNTDTFLLYPFNAELNPICHLQGLLGGAHHVLHVFRIRVKLRLFSKSQKNIMKYK